MIELNLIIKGTSQAEKIAESVPTLEEMIEAKKNKPKHLKHCSDKMINDLLKLYSTGWGKL